ncbi:DUF6777 domain-containing protein [Streptomyces sp.]|uniref:DUF6777 domain-containing protein n=1 Tax=Streptomyces sp. TaxID=1931 RepID=UPI002811EB10|nr:DUF6777 domain-containing protein [Streptomyces sp.]
MRTPTGAFTAACALSAALLLSACGAGRAGGGEGDGTTAAALVLQPAADPGPAPFTDSTAVAAPAPFPAGPAPRTAGGTVRVSTGPRSLSGATPGLYGGTERTGSCDIGRQIGHLTRDRAAGRAFARVAGVPPEALPDYVRALTPVVLRADTRVTGHGHRAGRVTGYQAVLQAGTAVLVDDRGVPRLRCACGNPLRPPLALRGTPATRGTPWPGYRPGEVIVVTPAPRAVADFTIIDLAARTWIERRPGHDVRHDRALPPPVWATRPPAPSAPSPVPPGASRTAPGADPAADPAPRRADGIEQPPADGTQPPRGEPAPREAGAPEADDLGAPEAEDLGAPDEVGPEAVPDGPDVPDGAGLIPDEPADDSIFGSPTDVFGN